MESYDDTFEIHANGFQNTGSICYFNSLLQGLLSCTSINKYFLEMTEPQNRLQRVYKQMITTLHNGNNNEVVQKWSSTVWNVFTSLCPKGFNFGRGQEDASEGLTLLLQTMNAPGVDYRMFHRYENRIACKDCKKVVSKTNDESLLCEIHLDDIKKYDGKIESFIRGHSPIMDNNYKCPNCKSRGNKIQKKILAMVPEVFIVHYKKFDKKWNAETPASIAINNGEKNMIYKLVSQTMHSGNRSGGHYWALATRKTGCFNLNDVSVRQITEKNLAQSSNQSYLLWYHFDHFE